MKKIFLFAAVTVLVSCTNKEPKKLKNTDIYEELRAEETPKSEMKNTAVFKKLQGTWINQSDTNSTLSFEGTSVINAYQDTLSIREVGFVLGNSCINTPSIANDKQNDLYITTIGQTSECYFIKELNDSILRMEFTTGKIDLSFVKKK